MKHYLVITPEYDYTEWVCEFGGPTYSECDAVEIEAENKRDAIALGVKYMLAHPTKFQYVHDQRSDNLSPYAGVKAILPEEEY